MTTITTPFSGPLHRVTIADCQASNPILPYCDTFTTDSEGRAHVPGQELHVFVDAGAYKSKAQYAKQQTDKINEAYSWIRDSFADYDGDSPWRDSVSISLEAINELVDILGCDTLTQVKTYSFSVSVRYEVSGEVTAASQEDAEFAVNQLLENMDDPDYTEPAIDGEWEYVNVSWADTEDFDVSEA